MLFKEKKNNLNKSITTYISEIFAKIAVLISIIIMISVIYFFYQIKIQNKIYVNILGYTILEVKSGSMEDHILIGDLLLVKVLENKNKDELKINDVITFRKEKHLITHRIIKLEENSLTTKGDANNTEDEPIVFDDIIGKVVKILPNVLIWKKVLAETKVLIPLIAGFTLFAIATIIDTREDSLEREKNEKRTKIQKGKRFKK